VRRIYLGILGFNSGIKDSFSSALVLMASNDPSDEVRKAAVRVLNSDNNIVNKTTVLLDKIFDIDEAVRCEAFKGLSSIPMSRIDKTRRLSILEWGLSQKRKFSIKGPNITL